jgi:RND superfamily putative drug exporter
MALVPAVMWLLDKRAWYMPRWLDRTLPNLTIEPPTPRDEPVAPRARPAAAAAGGRE